MSTYTYTCNKHRPVEAESPRDAARIFATRIARQLHGRSASAVTLVMDCRSPDGTVSEWCAFVGVQARGESGWVGSNARFKVHMRVNHYRYATDSESGTIAAGSIECAFDKLRARITDEMIQGGATLWVEDDNGNRLTL